MNELDFCKLQMQQSEMNRLIYDYLVDSGFKESAYVLKEETTVAPTKVN